MILFIIGGALMLGLSIFIHELGHYLAGKAVGVKAEIFSIGFGTPVWKRKIEDTTWQIGVFPLGGFVKFYGDDITNPEKIPGGFFSVPPLKRMIPVLGGPIFNLILGFILFLAVHSISGPLAPRVAFWEEVEKQTPAYLGGLREGDLVTAVNGQPVRSFIDIKKYISMVGGSPVTFTVIRKDGEENKELQFTITPEVDQSGLSFVGIRPPGERSLEVNYPTDEYWIYRIRSIFGTVTPPNSLKAMQYLNNEDIILSVEGREVRSVTALQKILGEYHGETVTVKVRRQSLPWLAPWFTYDTEVRIPSTGEYRIRFTGITDLKYNAPVPDRDLLSAVDEHQRALADIQINDQPAGSFQKMYDLAESLRLQSETESSPAASVRFRIGNNEYSGNIQAEKIGLLGFRARDQYNREYMERHTGIGEVFQFALNDTYDNIAVYPAFFGKLFDGRMSFMDNAKGPVGMFAIAGVVFKSGLHDYLQLFASISIALMVMNLLPFPLLDGGHIMFFLYEAVAGKPVNARVMDAMYRIAFLLLITLFMAVMYQDVIFFIGM